MYVSVSASVCVCVFCFEDALLNLIYMEADTIPAHFLHLLKSPGKKHKFPVVIDSL